MSIGNGGLRGTFRAEVDAELAKLPRSSPPPLLEPDLARLPAPVRRSIERGGFVGKPHTLTARTVWKEMYLKRSHDAEWLSVQCEQLNAVPEPVRIAFMHARVGGILSLEGRDKYQDGKGSMLVKLLNLFTLGDVAGPAMDESALVTVLSEALLAPSYAVQPYMAWEPIDDRSARARLSHNGSTVSGVFHFNERDELVRFVTEDRWQDGRPARKVPWSAEFAEYRVQRDGTRFPSKVSAAWHEAGGLYTYVRGTIASVEFNVHLPRPSEPGESQSG